MAHFFASIQGQRGKASRLGSITSGINATVASWQGAVDVFLWHNYATGEDMVRVSLKPWGNSGVHKVLFTGPVSGLASLK
jgi:hypothetical protein